MIFLAEMIEWARKLGRPFTTKELEKKYQELGGSPDNVTTFRILTAMNVVTKAKMHWIENDL